MSQPLPIPQRLIFLSLDIIGITRTFQGEGKEPKLFKLWKIPVKFSCAHSHSRRSFSQYLPFQPISRRSWKPNKAYFLGLHLQRFLHKCPSIPRHVSSLSDINGMKHIKSESCMCVNSCSKRERGFFFQQECSKFLKYPKHNLPHLSPLGLVVQIYLYAAHVIAITFGAVLFYVISCWLPNRLCLSMKNLNFRSTLPTMTKYIGKLMKNLQPQC